MAATAVMLTSGASGRVNALFSVQVWRSLLMLINAFIMLFFVPFRGRKRSVSAVEPPLKDEKQEVAAASSSGGGSRKGGPVVRVPTKRWKSSAAVVAAVDQEVAARRALAIKRVMQSRDEDSIREFSLFATPRGETLFTQSWRPVSNQIRGIVVVLHGLNEHGDRYTEFAKELNANSFKVYAMDWIGHGGSDGLHAYVHSLDVAVSDTVSFIKKVVAENPGLPCFCFGHSTGGAIVLKAVMDPKIEASVSGVVLTSPAVGVQPSHPIFAVLAPVCSFLFPRYQFRAANKQGMVVSRDPKALLAKYSDPLVYTGSIRIRTGYEILCISTYLQENVKKVKVPFLVLHGTADTITDPMGSKRLYEEASSCDKSIKMFDGFLHDLLFEPERDMVSQEIVDWLKSRV